MLNVVLSNLQDVLFGDIWVCSGQSNMEWPMKSIFNAQEEIADIATFDNIRSDTNLLTSYFKQSF
jgi:hypothetical protein